MPLVRRACVGLLLLPLLVAIGCRSWAGPRFELVADELAWLLPAAQVVLPAARPAPSAALVTSWAQWRRAAPQWGLAEAQLPTAGFDWRSTDLLVVGLGEAGGDQVRLDWSEEEGVDVLLVTRAPPLPDEPGRPAVLVAELVRRPAQLAVVFRQRLADQPGVERTLAVFASR